MRIGCCGFPVARKKYFGRLGVVELQRTFYDPPSPSLAEKWRLEAPGGFEFTLKAWQLITHSPESPTYRKLKTGIPSSKKDRYGSFRPTEEVLLAWERTREIAQVLRARVVVFQSPPSFEPSGLNKRNIERFFASIDRKGLTLCWEPRGRWESSDVKAICRDLRLGHAVDPFKTEIAYEKGPRYFRLHGKGGWKYKYTREDLTTLKGLVPKRRRAYYMFNNIHMFDDAVAFKKLLEKETWAKG